MSYETQSAAFMNYETGGTFCFLWRRAPRRKQRTRRSLEAYCATLWWRWLVLFSFFRVMEHRWNEIDRAKPKYSGKNLSQCHFVHHKSHMDWTRVSAGRCRRLTAWAMAQLWVVHVIITTLLTVNSQWLDLDLHTKKVLMSVHVYVKPTRHTHQHFT